jgi:endonuclease VIII
MDGSWKVNPVSKPSRAGHRIRIILEAGDVQAAGIDLGVLEVLERAHDTDVVSHLGPDLLGDDWDPRAAAANLVADPDRPLAEALLDQRVMAGVGNVYCNELCFVTGYLPTTPVDSVKDPLRMVQRARDMLWLNRSRWGRATTGDTRRGRELWVYDRAGQPCRRCGTPIESDSSGERVSFWCPVCQK